MSLQRGGANAGDAAEEMVAKCPECRVGRHEDCALHQYDDVRTEDIPDIVSPSGGCACECEGQIYARQVDVRLPPPDESYIFDRNALYGMLGEVVPFKLGDKVIGEAMVVGTSAHGTELIVTFEFPAQEDL